MSRSCNLTRVYSITSMVGIAIVATLLVLFYHNQATKALMEREGKSNSDISRAIANSLWPKYRDYIRTAGSLPLKSLPQHPDTARLREDILGKIRGLRIAKVKIYDLKGLVVYSTQPSQIGDNKFDNGGFQQALQGRIVNEIVYRNQFSAYEKESYERSLVSSYIPVRQHLDGPVEGVLELYSDVTQLTGDIKASSYRILFTVSGLMLLLYFFLLLIVRRAHKVILRHEKEQLEYLELHDELTGLYNRNGMLSALHRAYQRRHQVGIGIGVMAIKLLRFREINDSIGHQHGDELLRAAAKRIAACAPGGDAACRVDGDEFVMVLDHLLSVGEGAFIADKLRGMFTEPFHIQGRKIHLRLAMGADMAQRSERSAEQLLINANTALTVAKELSPGRYVVFDESLESGKQERFELEMDLGRAVREREFTLHYQPKVNTRSGKVVGMEALVRWQHPVRGLIMPDRFISLLEDSGNIVQVGEWLLQQACRQCREWHDEGQDELCVAVNVSLKQLHAGNFLDSVRHALMASRLPPHCLELEITESVLVEDMALTKQLLSRLKRIGVMLSIDDFGTGYSSLSYLVHFPVDAIKIDRSFIRDMIVNHNHAVLTGAIIAMAKSLNLGVIAEGVETHEQLSRVRNMACDEVQGFLFSKAVAPELFARVIDEINGRQVLSASP